MLTPKTVTSFLSASLLAVALSSAVAQTPPATPDNPPAASPDAGGAGGVGPGGPGFGPRGQGPGPGSRGMGPGAFGWGPGMMMGPGMMRGRGFMGGPGMMCNPRAAGLAGWRLRQVERAVKLDEAQRKALDELRTASAKAAESIAASCPTEIPLTSTGRLALMEKRMEAMLQAVKTVRPAFDAFYASLNDEQKARLDRSGPRNWGWRGYRDDDR